MLIRAITGALLSGCVFTGMAMGQGAVPAAPSSALNWLNLTRGGNPAVNYYGIVRPNNQTLNNFANLQQDYNSLTQSVTNMESTGIRATGHAATYMNYGHYYPRMNSSGPGSRTGQPGVPGRR